MAERDRAAVDVDLLLVDAEHPDRVDRDRGEGLVDLPEVDVLGASGRPCRGLASRPWPASWRGRRSRRRSCRSRRSSPRACLPLASAHSSEATTTAEAPSLTPGELPAVWVASSPPIAFSFASVSSVGVGADRLVGLDRRLALAALDRDADDLVGEAALVGRPGGELVRADGPAIEVGAGDLELVADLAGLVDHLLVGEGVGQPVVGHRVDRGRRRPSGSRSGRRGAGRGRSTSTPCRRRGRRRRRRRGSPGRAGRPSACRRRRPC